MKIHLRLIKDYLYSIQIQKIYNANAIKVQIVHMLNGDTET